MGGRYFYGGGGGAGSDTTAVHTDTGAEVSGVAAKASPIAADYLLIEDSAAADAKKSVTVGTLPVDLGQLEIAAEARGDIIVRDASGFTRVAIGGANEVLTSDGTDAAWAAAAGGLTNWTESRDTGTGNPTAIWTPATAATDHILLELDGGTTGGLYLGAVQDGTATGGNDRGAGAVDLQVTRGVAAQVASAANSGLFAGTSNTASGDDAVVLGSEGSTASGAQSAVVGGDSCTASGTDSFVGGGSGNTVGVATQAAILGGINNSITGGGSEAVIVGGDGNNITAAGDTSCIAGGSSNVIASNDSFIGGGRFNDIGTGHFWAAIVGGNYNQTTARSGVAMGEAALADHPTMLAFSGNSDGTISDADRGVSQGGLIHLDGATTDGSTINLDSIGTEIAIATDMALSYTGTVTAWNSTDRTTSGWLVSGTIDNPGGTPALAGNVETATANSSGATLAVSAVAAGTDLLRFAVTGVAAKNIRYSAALIISRVTVPQ